MMVKEQLQKKDGEFGIQLNAAAKKWQGAKVPVDAFLKDECAKL